MRIIAGSAKGRRFEAPAGMDTRPTLARVKESMFGILQFRIEGRDVLDLFSGSGNLGLEAASRGATSVVCNDHDRACAALIRRNAAALGLNAIVRVLCLDYAAAISRLSAEGFGFDLAFLDAPYADGTAAKAAALLFERGMIRRDGLVVIEHDRALPPVPDKALCRICDQRVYGDVAIMILERAI